MSAWIVRQISLPYPLQSRISDGQPLTFSQLFDWMFNEMNVITIAVQRSPENHAGCPLSYVFTNPCIDLGSDRGGIFSFLSRIVLDEGTLRPLPRRLPPRLDPEIHEYDRIYIIPCGADVSD